MLRLLPLAVLLSSLLCAPSFNSRAAAQIEEVPHPNAPGANQAPPRYDRDKEAGESSSRDTKIDLSPPKDDAKDHPFSDASDSDTPDSSIQEVRPWDPHKAAKDVEVGDFYFKRKNYHAAIARYQDALMWKDNDADAHFRLGQAFDKIDNSSEAATHYQEYLKIVPHGPFAEEAQKGLQRLKSKAIPPTSAKQDPTPLTETEPDK